MVGVVALVVAALTVPVNGTPNVLHWGAGRMLGTWTVDTTPRYKGHSPAGMHSVCVNNISDEIRLVPITARQAYGDPVTGAGAIQAGDPC